MPRQPAASSRLGSRRSGADLTVDDTAVLTEGGTGVHALAVDHLTRRYRKRAVVRDLSFVVRPGRVTGLLGANGSGKSTTVKILLDLASADDGTANVGATRYRDLPDPGRTVGAVLE